MENKQFNTLLLRTAFSCMACDGDIDQREVELIKTLANETKLFGEVNFNNQLNALLEEINQKGHQFLKDYFKELNSIDLSKEEELKVIRVSLDTINADDVIEYSEIKFFKIIRSKLHIANEDILEEFPDIEEYLEQDIISHSYLSSLQDDFFDSHQLPVFEPIHKLDDDVLRDIEEKN